MFCSIKFPLLQVFIFQFKRLKVREAAGVFFIVVGNGKDGLIELIVAKLMEGDGGCDGGKHGDICRETRAPLFITLHLVTPAWAWMSLRSLHELGRIKKWKMHL